MAESSVPFPTGSGPTKVAVRSVERPADAGWTMVGGLDDFSPGRVDAGGAVAPTGANWCVDWWIGAQDRWHFPSREPSVRQSRLGPGPIVETAARVPGGDIVSTVYPVTGGRKRAVAIEVRNDAKAPVSLALALRSLNLDGSGPHSHRLELLDPRTVGVDAVPALLLPRPASQAACTLSGEFPGRLIDGGDLSWDGPVAGVGAEAVLVYPLPHGTSLRFTVVTAPDDRRMDDIRPEALPDADAVRRGWATVVDTTARAAFPDPGLTDLASAARARLIIEAPRLPNSVADIAPGAGVVLSGLAAAGRNEECRVALLALASGYRASSSWDPTAAAELLVGTADAATLLGDRALCEQLLEPAMGLTRAVDRTGSEVERATAQLALADLAALTSQHEAAASIRSDVGDELAQNLLDQRLDLDAVTALALSAGDAGRLPGPQTSLAVLDPDSAEAAARFWLAARGLLIRRPVPGGSTPSDSTELELLPEFPSAWMGGQLEVHDLPVAGQRLSFAIRWHGPRPALLWQVAEGPSTPGGGDVAVTTGELRLRCPGLDPHWSTTDSSGEALLLGSPEPLPDVPEPGDSFT